MADLEIIKTEVEEQLGIRQQHAPCLRLEAGRHKAVKARLEFRHRFPLLAIQKLHIALQSEEVLAAIKNDALPGQAGRGYDRAHRADPVAWLNAPAWRKIGSEHAGTPVTNPHVVCCLMLD